MSIVEVLVASIILAAVAVPLLTVFTGGLKMSKASIDEVTGANLAAEIAEQFELVPFSLLETITGGGVASYASADGTLQDGTPLAAGSPWKLRVAALPMGFTRKVTLQQAVAGVVLVSVDVVWEPAEGRTRTLTVKRLVVDHSALSP